MQLNSNRSKSLHLLELKNSQGQNLLNPTTVGHYDTALIKKLNGDKIKLSKPGSPSVVMSFDYTADSGIRIFNLTTTDQDTININSTISNQQCSIYYNLQTVQYNGVTLKADSGTLYIAHK